MIETKLVSNYIIKVYKNFIIKLAYELLVYDTFNREIEKESHIFLYELRKIK